MAAHPSARQIQQLLQTDRMLGMADIPLGPQPSAGGEEPASPEPSASTGGGGSSPPESEEPSLLDASPLPPAGMGREEKRQALDALGKEHAAECPLCAAKGGELNMVFGEGDPDANLVFVGEGPGEEENRLGRPFVGKAGKKLDEMVAAMGLRRDAVYIANTVKTQPPSNRVPTPEEAGRCMPYLVRQLQILEPSVIVTLGGTATKYVLDSPKLSITKTRGHWKQFRGIPVMPTFHPAYLLRQYTVENRRRVWSDLQQVMQQLGLA